ncbi:Mitotic checkpoint [Moelleriella libera RCEF 2490]|uniref:Spindle assembly checkpoint component MAD1 n=1 Tax=Moelleriella libera RCEF 2490 TaxID=1081109 RepID=A0A162IJZ9_9HYPO|nr:Mitotic checkpoint [Moelleriella libera RCEF 2490]
MAPPDADEYEKYRKEVEALKAEIGTLQYRMQTAEQEKEIALSQQSSKLEQARRREQDEIQLRQDAEARQGKAVAEAQALRSELDSFKEEADATVRDLERKARQAEDESRLLQEQLEDLLTSKEDAARVADKKATDLHMQIAALQHAVQEWEKKDQAKDDEVRQAQLAISEKEGHVAQLEADLIRLRAQSGDAAETMEIKKQLSENIRDLVAMQNENTELRGKLAQLEAVEVLQEKIRVLQNKLERAESLELELAETRLQRQQLEDERREWVLYLENSSETGENEFDSPKAVARALFEERLTIASYVEQLGAAQAQNTAQSLRIQSLQEETHKLKEALRSASSSSESLSNDKARLRIDRQRVLALKEVEYLRAQLKALDSEDLTMQPDQYDETRASRISELEAVIDNYKTEVQKLHNELSSAESGVEPPALQPTSGNKRTRAEDEEIQEQLGQMTRKNRKLQDEVMTLNTRIALLEKDLAANSDLLSAAKEHNSRRVLSLRSNPTSDHEAIKRSTLDALQSENSDLLAQLRSRHPNPSIPVIPTSVLGAMEREIAAAKAETASAQKSAKRLKEVWASKSQEFKEAIFSTLGWTVTFIPNGKMRVENIYFPSQTDEHENSIVFDGERGTMKVGGGPKSPFARRIGDQIRFWVREKGCIPGFLAALTLEFYEEHSRAAQN